MLQDLLESTEVELYPYARSFEEATTEPFCLLHTSGSTGLPKPIPWSHGLIGTMDAIRLLPPTEGDNDMVPWTADWRDDDQRGDIHIHSHSCNDKLSHDICHGAADDGPRANICAGILDQRAYQITILELRKA